MFHSIPFGGHRGVRHYPCLVVGVWVSTQLLILAPSPDSATRALGNLLVSAERVLVLVLKGL